MASSPKTSPRVLALFETLLVTILWASSFVLVKLALPEIGPLTTAGLRYFIAFLALCPFFIRKRASIRKVKPRTWLVLLLIGLCAYTIGNGAFFWGLKYLPATTTSFLMSVNPILILLAGIWWLKEVPTRLQVVGVVVCLAGSVLFFSNGLKADEPLGLLITIVGVLGFSLFGILSRAVARERQVDTLVLTAVPLGFGGGILLLLAIIFEGVPHLSLRVGGILLWLALPNTAVAYMLYNHSLRNLTALEMTVMLNLSPLGTALLAWLVLGERITLIKLAGMVVLIVGVVLVQQRTRQRLEINTE
jgi:drug/metabolite transporter (DMT)-like permease